MFRKNLQPRVRGHLQAQLNAALAGASVVGGGREAVGGGGKKSGHWWMSLMMRYIYICH